MWITLRVSTRRKEPRKLLCNSWPDDLRKILVNCILAIITIGTSRLDFYAMSTIVITQSILNIDTYWDFIKDESYSCDTRIASSSVIVAATCAFAVSVANVLQHLDFYNTVSSHLMTVMEIILVNVHIPVLILDLRENYRREKYDIINKSRT